MSPGGRRTTTTEGFLDAGLNQSYAVLEKLVCGSVEEGRIMSVLRNMDCRGKVNQAKVGHFWSLRFTLHSGCIEKESRF